MPSNLNETTSSTVMDADAALMGRVAHGDERAIGVFIDRWATSLLMVTDRLRIDSDAGDVVVEEVMRRAIFEAPRFVVRPEKFSGWLRGAARDCASAVLMKQSIGREQTDTSVGFDDDSLIRVRIADSCASMLRQHRPADALELLNSLTAFRFTAVYRFDGMSLENVYLFDRQGGFGSDKSVVRTSETYCLWIQESLSVVQMKDSRHDPRAIGHPKRDCVRSYCGGPIRDEKGKLVGTICHFDYDSRDIPHNVLGLLEAVGPLFAETIAPG